MPVFLNSSLTAKCFTPFHCTCCHMYWSETCSSPAIASFSIPRSFLDAIDTPFGGWPGAFQALRCHRSVDRLQTSSPLWTPHATSVSLFHILSDYTTLRGIMSTQVGIQKGQSAAALP